MDPFAPIPEESSPSAAGGEPCPQCGQPMDPRQAAYDPSGRLVCKTCMSASTVAQADRTIEERDPGSTRNLYLGAAGAALVGITTCCLSGFGVFGLILAPGALLSGGWTIQHLVRTPDVQAQLGTTGYVVVLLLSIVGVLFGLLAMIFGALALIGASLPYGP